MNIWAIINLEEKLSLKSNNEEERKLVSRFSEFMNHSCVAVHISYDGSLNTVR